MDVGLDRLLAEEALRKKVVGARVGLLAHPASVTRSLAHAEDVLRSIGAAPRIIFGPEHGYGGEAQYMDPVGDESRASGPPVRSLYGARFEDLSPTPSDLADLDVLVVDLQDVGARYYTFVWTALLALRACRSASVRVLLLDRPNPIGGHLPSVEGALPEKSYLSFVGLEALPVRHALTPGEIIALFARRDGVTTDLLSVVRVRGLEPDTHAPRWDRPFVPPSPNMPTYDTALVYPGACLLEGTNLSEGRGTTRPFEMVGAPWLDGRKLAASLVAAGLPGFAPRPVSFVPTFQKYAGERCFGVHVHVTDPLLFRPYATYLALVAAARAQAPERFAFRTEPYEFRDDVPAFDLLTGSSLAREMIAAGRPGREVADTVARVSRAEQETHEEARGALERYAV